MKFCVTGATGMLGNNLCRLLLDQGHEVRVNVRSSSNRKPIADLPVEVREGALDSPEFVAELLDGADGVFHAAALIWLGRRRLQESLRVNVDMTGLIARQCLRNAIRMVHVSSTDALAAGTRDCPATENDLHPPKGSSNYVVTKRKAEAELLNLHEQQRLDVVIVNPCLLLGPWDWKPSTGQMILAVTDGYVPLAPAGGISVADVRQVARATIAAFHKGTAGKRYILAGDNLTYLELWQEMAGLAGRHGPLGKLGWLMGKAAGGAGDLIGLVRETNLNSAAIQLGRNYNYYDSSRAIAELDYHPGSRHDALLAAWEWLLENGYSRHSQPRRR